MEESTQRYALGEKLHQGQRASVYRAVRKADGHRVVLRLLDGDDPVAGRIEQLKHELDLRSTLQGLPAVEPLALSTLNGAPALELEDFVGESLDRLVRATSVAIPQETEAHRPARRGWWAAARR